ncbi:MAG: hypothetical protein N4A33_12755 [Bacteriovoracaceae bacterium]|nr:hypothetical protein [Bacteriovoracaceae bacterium]
MKKLILLSLVTFGLISCGSNESGSSSSSYIPQGQAEITSQPQNYGTIESLREAFSKKSLTEGLGLQAEVYHVGSAFGAQGGFLNFNFNFCFSSSQCTHQNMMDIVESGELKVVTSLDHANSISIKEAVGVNNGQYIYSNGNFDRNDSLYQQMLGYNLSGAQTTFRSATIRLSNGQTIQGQYVEFYISTGLLSGQRKGYVLSTNLPVLANPILVKEGGLFVNQITGQLKRVGNITIQSVTF